MNEQKNNQQRINPAKLLDIFSRQKALGEEFLALLAEEKSALVEMEMQTLISLSHRKEHQLLRLKTLDDELQAESRRLWPEDRSNNKIIKLAALAPFVSEEEHKQLADYRDSLTKLHEEIQEKNLFNKQFAEDTGKYLNDAIRLISTAVADHSTYSTRGTEKQAAAQASLLSREV
ncbi:MAG: flagellar protein FlgN [Desulfobulbaceae bacterium]|nr:flagellar protein FlgN [Desulfobulbaceae bacterium]